MAKSKYRLTVGKRNGYASFPKTLVEGIFWDKVKQKLADVLENLLSRVSALEEGGGGGGTTGVSVLIIPGVLGGGAFAPDNNTTELFDQALNGMKNGTLVVYWSARDEGMQPGEEYMIIMATFASTSEYLPAPVIQSSDGTVWERPSEG